MAGWGSLDRIIADAQQKREEEQQRRQASPLLRLQEREPQRISPPLPQQQAPPITQTNNPPPLPTIRPMATPVMDLKRETANFWNFSPEARTELYDTPTLVNYRERESIPEGEPAGYYRPPGFNYDDPNAAPGNHQIMVNETGRNQPFVSSAMGGDTTWPSVSAGTLAHEFGHKWDHEQVPDDLRSQWYDDRGWQGSSYWNPSLYKKWNTGDSQADTPLMAGETYANSVMMSQTPGQEMQPWFRDKYFAGLFNDGASKWQPPYTGAPPPTSDRLRELDPMYWGPDMNGLRG